MSSSIGNAKKILDRMEAILERAKGIPLTSFVMIDKEELINEIDRLRDSLPSELEEAANILNRKEEIFRDGHNAAEKVLTDAKREAMRLIEDNEITKNATINASKMEVEAKEAANTLYAKVKKQCISLKRKVIKEAISIREGADRYAETVLTRLAADMNEAKAIADVGQAQLTKLKENSDIEITNFKSMYDSEELLLNYGEDEE